MSSLVDQHRRIEAHPLSEKSWPVQGLAYCSSMLLQECYQSVSELQAALSLLDKAGAHLTACLVKGLEHTAYRCVGDVLGDRLGDVFTIATSKASTAALQEIETLLAGLLEIEKQQGDLQVYEQTLCHIALLFAKMKKQYYSLCHCKMVDLVHALLCLQGEDPASGEVTKLVLKLGLADGLDSPYKSNASLPNTPWGSPKLRKSLQDPTKPQSRSGFRIMSLFERKTPPDERQGPFSADTDEQKSGKAEVRRDGLPTVSVTMGSHENSGGVASFTAGQGLDVFSTNRHYCHHGHVKDSGRGDFYHSRQENPSVFVSSRPQLATEEELESVINLLSGVGCGSVSPMQVIPEVVAPPGSMQLTVPQIYRTVSPVSDTHLEESRKSQVHRRSEGCLDLSAMGRNMWPHQHQYHHRASLPSVQIFSAASPRSGYDPSSPVPPYLRDTPSPNYSMRDTPSPGFYPDNPPSPYRSHYTKTVGVGMGAVRPNMLSPMQWLACPPSGSTGGGHLGGFDPNLGHHGAWPTYGGMASVSPSVGESSSWLGTQDCSDLSDDSSTEDQFFAVGKDLSHVISSKDGSSDEERDSGQQEMSKSPCAWPPPNPHSFVNISRGLTPDLLEPPEAYNTHKPIQMQWSDPLSSRSVWEPSPQEASHHKTSQSMQGFGGAS